MIGWLETDEISLLGSKVNHLTTGYSRGIVFAMHNVNPQDEKNVDIAILLLVLVKIFRDTIQRFTITLHEWGAETNQSSNQALPAYAN